MRPFLHYFRLPLIASVVALILAVAGGLVGITLISRSGATRSQIKERAEMLGSGLGLATAILAAPFWLLAASRYAKDRRQVDEARRSNRRSRR